MIREAIEGHIPDNLLESIAVEESVARQALLLIDEADSFLKDNEGAGGILNASHKQGGGAIRLVGDQYEPKKFNCYTPDRYCRYWLDNRRTMDNWHPLFVTAEILKGEWPSNCFAAFTAINTNDSEDESIGAMLLEDIEHTFEWKKVDRIHSAELVDCLVVLEGRPWSE